MMYDMKYRESLGKLPFYTLENRYKDLEFECKILKTGISDYDEQLKDILRGISEKSEVKKKIDMETEELQNLDEKIAKIRSYIELKIKEKNENEKVLKNEGIIN